MTYTVQIQLAAAPSLDLIQSLQTIPGCESVIANTNVLTVTCSEPHQERRYLEAARQYDHNNNNVCCILNLHVTGMMCQRNCGTTVQNCLQQLPHVQSATVSFAESRATIVTNEPGQLEECIDEIDCIGFEASYIPNIEEYLQKLQADDDKSNNHPNVSENTQEPVVTAPRSDKELLLKVSGMSCAVCTGRVERALQSAVVDPHAQISVVLANGTAVVESPSSIDKATAQQCVQAVQAAGYECEPILAPDYSQDAISGEWKAWRRLLVIAVSLTVPLVVLDRILMRRRMSSDSDSIGWILLGEVVLSSCVQFGVGKRFYVSSYHGLRDNIMGMDFLVCLGTTASYLYSMIVVLLYMINSAQSTINPTFTTGAMLLSFVTLGKFLESYAKGKTASALKTLLELQPLFAFKVEPTTATEDLPSAPETEVSVQTLRIGDVLRVKAGGRIPTDGVLVAISSNQNAGLEERAFVDESALSGEPFPVAKRVGDIVTGSTVNQFSTLHMRVTAVGENTALSKIVRLMEKAQRNKAPIQAYADRIACVFAPSVIVLAALTFVCWLSFNGSVTSQERFFAAFTSAISVIVVACPCALGLATPTAVMVGCGVGASQGTLIKGGAVLESMHSVDTIVFDKTGTLTTGRAVLGDDCSEELLSSLPDSDPLLQNLPTTIDKTNIALWLAACAEAQSEHPLAKSIINAARSKWGNDVTCSREGVHVENFVVAPGRGVECWVSKAGWGRWNVRVGSRQWAKAPSNENCDNLLASSYSTEGDDLAARIRSSGQIAVYLSVNEPQSQKPRRVISVFGILDPVQKQAKSTVAALREMGVDVWLCTGDHELTARAVARSIGIDEDNVCAGVSPEGKADLVTRLQKRDRSLPPKGVRRLRKTRQSGKVAVVGDGINDAVALARADVGIAIGAGTEVAVEAADVVLVRSSLHDVVVAFHLSKVVFRRIILNFVWATGYNIFALPFAAGVMYPFTDFRLPPELAGLMMAFSSVSVVTSSLLLRRYLRPTIVEDGKLKGGKGCLMVVENLLSRLCLRCGDSCPQYERVPLKLQTDEMELV